MLDTAYVGEIFEAVDHYTYAYVCSLKMWRSTCIGGEWPLVSVRPLAEGAGTSGEVRRGAAIDFSIDTVLIQYLVQYAFW